MQEKGAQIRRLENKNLQLVRMNQTLETELERLRQALDVADENNAAMEELVIELQRKLDILFNIIKLDGLVDN